MLYHTGFRQTWAWGSADPIIIPFVGRWLFCFGVAFAPHNGKTASEPRPLCAPKLKSSLKGKTISIISRSANNSVVARRWPWAGPLRQQAVCTYRVRPAWVTATTAWTLTGRPQSPRDERGEEVPGEEQLMNMPASLSGEMIPPMCWGESQRRNSLSGSEFHNVEHETFQNTHTFLPYF